LINLFILFYRTTLIFVHPEQKLTEVPISSALFEMAALLNIDGIVTEVYRATKHWIMNWEAEKFSKELSDAISIDKYGDIKPTTTKDYSGVKSAQGVVSWK
jgi:hypothetical protein